MSLESGKRIHSNKWDELPITSEVIKKVHELADSQGQPWLHDDPFTLSHMENDGIHVVETVDDIVTNDQLEDGKIASHHDEGQEDTETDHEEPSTYSSGTTLEASDSTFTTDSTFSPEASQEGEGTEDDIVHSDETATEGLEINSNDFSFNLANAYENNPEESDKNYQKYKCRRVKFGFRCSNFGVA